MRPIRTMLMTLLAAAGFSASSRAQEPLILSDATRSDGTSFVEQLRSAPEGRIALINTFQVTAEEAEAFKRDWSRVAEILRRKPGFVSSALHRPVGGSTLWVNHAVWENAQSLAAALASPEFRAAAASLNQMGFRRIYKAEPALGPLP
ncbi:antibiotic biosynthesis monooxygenase family protein [Microvirga arsenatis]|uniref:ABM domain-containing protein n=1 Tax=Microvirga arsenatis TaxID=2692265 RepID=A0ABW9YU42_9HYPH|nr:antibiotic biosynthesis monooxygenase family protein [Microvirga arsenatis]NBJ09546.1 hypothetical protein [Microvirga arsenatis]NBJ23595.1 hypothetical protein [Microvirga arsenatis]